MIVVRVLTLCVSLLAARSLCGQVRTVAVTQQAAPGIGPGAAFYQFSRSAGGAQTSLNDDGQTAFLGRVLGGSGGSTTTSDTGIWSDGAGTLSLIAREGAQAPGTPAGAVFSELVREPVLNDAGQIAFPALLREGAGGVTSTNSAGLWAQRNGQLQLVVRSASQAPGTPAGAFFRSFLANTTIDGFFAFNNPGSVAFTSSLGLSSGGVTTSNDSGIWSDLSGAMALVAREGDYAPGTATGAVFDDLTSPSESPVLNNSNQLAFTAQLRVGAGGVVTGDDFGIWLADDDGVNLIVREGAAAPAPANATFRHFSEVQINDSGNLLFRGLLNPGPGGVTSNDDECIWLRRDEELVLAAREGTLVPGAASAVKYGSFSAYTLNNHDRAAVSGYLQIGAGGATADNNAAVWAGISEHLRITAREGQVAPGSTDAVFADFFAPNINATGKVAFMATLKPNVGGVDATNDRGIWATDAAGTLQLIAREGDQLEVAPGDFRTVTALSFRGNSGNADGRYSVFNDRGEVQFWAQFGLSEGIFISAAVASDPLPTDFNGDGAVNGVDLQSWGAGYGTASPATSAEGDANGDQIVDGGDFLAWQQQVTVVNGVTAVTGVPEPAALALWTLMCAVGLIKRPRGGFHSRPIPRGHRLRNELTSKSLKN